MVHVHGTAQTEHGYKRGYKVLLRTVIVHILKSLKLQDSVSRTARTYAGEMPEPPSMRGF